MTELSDYRRMVEAPMLKRMEAKMAGMRAENERLRGVAAEMCQAWYFGTFGDMTRAIEKTKAMIDEQSTERR